MFIIWGFNSKVKELGNGQMVICRCCGSYGRYQVFMTYDYFSIFFIPIIKYNRKYYVKMSCCQAQYELNPEIGKSLARGGQMDIAENDLTLVSQGSGNPYAYRNTEVQSTEEEPKAVKTCSSCGFEADESYEYCPKCGTKF